MSSPFPGMNPFLEQEDSWQDFHQDFISRSREMISKAISENYIAKIETRLYVHELSAEERRHFGRADVSISANPALKSSGSHTAVLTAPAPVELIFPAVDFERHTWLEVIDRRNRKVVTVLELLSPTNKTPGPDHYQYLNKRAVLLNGSVHFVEIDLRRGGARPQPPILPACDYYALVSRKEHRPRIGMWPTSLRERLPVIPIPLNAPDPDIALDLQAVLHRVYDAADYGKYIYSEHPDPPLSADDAAWAAQILANAANGKLLP